MPTAVQRVSRRGEPRGAEPAPPPRPAIRLSLALALAGLALALYLVRLHSRAHAGETSFCAISETVDCDRVATSRYSVFLGLPVAAWGAFGFALQAALAASGLARRRPRAAWPAGLLLLLGLASVAASVALALVSELAIGAWCLLCIGAWLVSLGLLLAARRACRQEGAAAAVRADLAALRERPGRTGALAAALLAALGLSAAWYPRFWEKPARPAPAARGPAAPGALPREVVEYTDFECPYCARAHEEERAILAANPGLTIARRNFPLDDTCNPAVKRAIHPGACDAARAAICAEAQGQLARMEDVLFKSQGKGVPPLEAARAAGLDLDRFAACLASPETSRRLAQDVAAGVRDGIRALPTYLVDGRPFVGSLPPDLGAGAAGPVPRPGAAR